MLPSDHKLPFSCQSCCPTPLICSDHPLYLPLVNFPDSRYNFLDKYSLCPMICVLHLTSLIKRLFPWAADTTVAFKFTSPPTREYLSAELALWVVRLVTWLMSQILEERGCSQKLLHAEHLLSVFFLSNESPLGIVTRGGIEIHRFWVLAKTFWAHLPLLGCRKPDLAVEPHAVEGRTGCWAPAGSPGKGCRDTAKAQVGKGEESNL